jgi:Zn-dependent protease with chaperone function
MFPSVILPLLAAIALAVSVTTVHRRLPPVLASRAVATTVIVVAGAAVPTLWIVGLGYFTHAPFFGSGLRWCVVVFGAHDRVSPWIGLPSLLLAASGTVRALRVIHTHHRLRYDRPGSVEIAHHEQPFAFTLPGRGGHVVLSSGLVDLLDDDEQRVVLAHEGAHATHRHDRYLLVAQLAATIIPILRPLASRLHFSLERWADEAAVEECGDRRFVARTLGKVALHGVAPIGALSFAGLGVSARVAALLSPPSPTPRSRLVVGLWLAISATGALAAFQIHHLARLVTALCPG